MRLPFRTLFSLFTSSPRPMSMVVLTFILLSHAFGLADSSARIWCFFTSHVFALTTAPQQRSAVIVISLFSYKCKSTTNAKLRRNGKLPQLATRTDSLHTIMFSCLSIFFRSNRFFLLCSISILQCQWCVRVTCSTDSHRLCSDVVIFLLKWKNLLRVHFFFHIFLSSDSFIEFVFRVSSISLICHSVR